MAQICELKAAEPVQQPDHILIVKHDDGTFEVSGTAGAGRPDVRFLTPAPFDDKDEALDCAETFAAAYALPVIYVKGFRVSQ